MRSETAIGPGARAAAAVRLRERLVQVEVDDVEAHVARARDAHHGVEVRAVVVERRADVVHDLRDLLDVRVEDAERVRVGEHQAGDVVVGLRAQVVEVDAAVGVGADLDDLVAGHRHRRRVRAVRGVGREDLGALLAAVLVVGARQQHAGELAVRARRSAAARRAAGRRSRPARARGSTSAPARPARAPGPAAGAGARGRAAPRRARAAAGCASSCTSRAGRSRSRGRSCAWRGRRSGARSRARRPRAGAAARAAQARRGAARAARSGTSSAGRRTRAARERPSRRSSSRRRAAAASRSRRSGPRGPPSRRLRGAGECGWGAVAPAVWRSAATAAPSTSARRSMSALERCSVIATSRPSACSA